MKKYTCPMHPQILKDDPGNCPLCGMDLIPIVKDRTRKQSHHSGSNENSEINGVREEHFDKHKGHHIGNFIKRFWVCLFLTVPILLLSHMIQQWLGINISFLGDDYLLLTLGTIVFVYGGFPFFKGLVGEIRAMAIGMMTLVSLAISVAYFYSVAVILGLQGMDFFWELATLIDIMLIGHWLEMRSQMRASRALESLVELLPNQVSVERNGLVITIGLEDLANNDTVIVKPGEKIPADGPVIDGLSYVDESMLTGESTPSKKSFGSKVIAGSINGDGMLKVKATGIGKNSYLNKIIDLVQDAQNAKSNTQNLADKVAKWLTFIAIATGIATFMYWYISMGEIAFALERMVTVMITACPHALGVAIPLVVSISATLSATKGLLIRNRTAFELTRKLNLVIFDKTGTLTKGGHEVKRVVILAEQFSAPELMQFAASVQQHSEHHIAKGILKASVLMDLPIWKSDNFQYIQGVGVTATVKGKKIAVVGPNFFRENKMHQPAIPDDIEQAAETIVFILVDEKPAGLITLSDALREGSKPAIDQLKKLGIKSFLLTGDNENIARSVASELEMDGYLANVLPHEKREKVKSFQEDGTIVAMVGDGINDAPALAQADIGIAIGSGTDVAAETADIILVNSDPKDVVNMVSFGKRTYSKMIQNLIWAVGYNVVSIPLAAGIFYPKFVLSPALGAILMSASTVVVAINATFLKFSRKN